MPDDPHPKTWATPYTLFKWPEGEERSLPSRSAALTVDMVRLLDERYTLREFGSRLSTESLAHLLWLTCRSRSSRPSRYGFDQESRPHPSAGAAHPIHLLTSHGGSGWARYDAQRHVLVDIPGSQASLAAVRQAAAELLTLNQGELIWLVAEPGKTAAKYDNPDSLVWRDAGVVLGYMSIVAQALSLSFCPLGITGAALPSAISGLDDRLMGAGLAVIGRP